MLEYVSRRVRSLTKKQKLLLQKQSGSIAKFIRSGILLQKTTNSAQHEAPSVFEMFLRSSDYSIKKNFPQKSSFSHHPPPSFPTPSPSHCVENNTEIVYWSSKFRSGPLHDALPPLPLQKRRQFVCVCVCMYVSIFPADMYLCAYVCVLLCWYASSQ